GPWFGGDPNGTNAYTQESWPQYTRFLATFRLTFLSPRGAHRLCETSSIDPLGEHGRCLLSPHSSCFPARGARTPSMSSCPAVSPPSCSQIRRPRRLHPPTV